MLETVDEYAREKLERSKMGHTLRSKHAKYYLELAEEADRTFEVLVKQYGSISLKPNMPIYLRQLDGFCITKRCKKDFGFQELYIGFGTGADISSKGENGLNSHRQW